MAGWHPDGRVSLLGLNAEGRLGFWTMSLDGAEVVESEVPQKLSNQMSEGSFVPLRFLWSPVEGDCLYFMAVSGGAPDIFKVAVDPKSLRWLDMPEPLTRSSTLEVGMALSRDGKKLAFTPGTQRVGIWLFPFDASTGEIKGEGRLVSPGGLNASRPDMPAEDDSRLLYRLFAPEGVELWSKSLEDDSEELLTQNLISGGRWSRDGKWLCYEEADSEGLWLVVRPMWGESTRLISPQVGTLALGGFTADGKSVLASLPARDGGDYVEILSLPIDQAPRAESGARILASDPQLNLWQSRSSPDDRWVAFVAVKRNDPQGAAEIHVVPSSGGEWIPIVTGSDWNDKPRWAPDGKTIFFVSNRGGFFNVWGQRFNIEEGRTVGEPFRVSNFRLPGKTILEEVVELELTLSQTQLALPLTQFFGQNVWVLEDVD
jgi:Tol biopolymer transport system component